MFKEAAMSSTGAANKKQASTKMHVVTDEQGRVVAAAHVGGARADNLGVGIQPLPGQRLHEVEVPSAVARLQDAHHLETFFAAARLDANGRLVLPEVEVVQAKHRSEE
jgi:hypothetical protein